MRNLTTIICLFFAFATVASAFYGSNSKVVKLTSANFKEKVLNGNEVWFVEFYGTLANMIILLISLAPWCGHCKNLIPEWEKLASALDGIVKVGAVDMTTDQVSTSFSYIVVLIAINRMLVHNMVSEDSLLSSSLVQTRTPLLTTKDKEALKRWPTLPSKKLERSDIVCDRVANNFRSLMANLEEVAVAMEATVDKADTVEPVELVEILVMIRMSLSWMTQTLINC